MTSESEFAFVLGFDPPEEPQANPSAEEFFGLATKTTAILKACFPDNRLILRRFNDQEIDSYNRDAQQAILTENLKRVEDQKEAKQVATARIEDKTIAEMVDSYMPLEKPAEGELIKGVTRIQPYIDFIAEYNKRIQTQGAMPEDRQLELISQFRADMQGLSDALPSALQMIRQAAPEMAKGAKEVLLTSTSNVLSNCTEAEHYVNNLPEGNLFKLQFKPLLAEAKQHLVNLYAQYWIPYGAENLEEDEFARSVRDAIQAEIQKIQNDNNYPLNQRAAVYQIDKALYNILEGEEPNKNDMIKFRVELARHKQALPPELQTQLTKAVRKKESVIYLPANLVQATSRDTQLADIFQDFREESINVPRLYAKLRTLHENTKPAWYNPANWFNDSFAKHNALGNLIDHVSSTILTHRREETAIASGKLALTTYLCSQKAELTTRLHTIRSKLNNFKSTPSTARCKLGLASDMGYAENKLQRIYNNYITANGTDKQGPDVLATDSALIEFAFAKARPGA